MPSLGKVVAILAGTGTAVGLYITSAGAGQQRTERTWEANPLPIEPLLDRMEQVEARLANLQQEVAPLVDAKTAADERIAMLERAMTDQLKTIDGLRDRAVESEANLQRLIAVVERLSERQAPPSSTVLPFEAQLAEAVQRDLPGETRVRVIKENEPERRHRFPLGRTFAFLLAALLPGFHR